MTKVAILALNGCQASGIHGLVDTFVTANYVNVKRGGERNLFDTVLVSPDGNAVTAFNGSCLEVAAALHEVGDVDVIIVGAAFETLSSEKKIRHRLQEFEPLSQLLAEKHKAGCFVAGCCTGSFLLAQAGLLQGKAATTHWRLADMLQRLFPDVLVLPNQLLIEGERTLCAGGAMSFFELGFRIIELFAGSEVALGCSKLLVVDPSRESQAPYHMFLPRRHNDEAVKKAENWLRESFEQNIHVESLADDLGIGRRHFKRRFKQATGCTPLAYLQSIRIEAAKNKLELTNTPGTNIIWSVGYEDSSSFRRLFKREVGMTMEEYRRRFARRSVMIEA